MAANTHHMWTRSRELTCTAPATPASGDPVICGQIPGVALADEDAAGLTTVALDGVFDLAVEGVIDGGNSAVAKGDILYYDSAATVKVNKDVTNGVRFGYALGTVASAATGTIPVEIGY
jgi:predicted RecA/RadA family phage recombinase